MTLFDDRAAHELDSATSVSAVSEQSSDSSNGSTHSSASQTESPNPNPVQEEKPSVSTAVEEKPAATAGATEDFASALETFTTEAEESVGEDRVIKGTVLKLTPTHVVVDIGAKSEGMLPLAEVLDHEGKPRFQPGDEIDVRRDKGETE